MTFYVPKSYNGKLLREFIKNECSITHNMLVRLKKIPFGILLNGEKVTVRAVIKTGDAVTLSVEDIESDVNPNVFPCGEMTDILYEDEAVLVVNKPSGMPTHTSHGHREDSLSNRVCAYFEKDGIPFVFRAINRLDRDTSGVVLIAKNAFYAAKLSKALAEGRFEKHYIALLDGKVEESGKIEGYIRREEKSIIKRSFSTDFSEDADYSLTKYKRLCEKNGISVVLVKLETGRTHQIRVHFSSVGAPVLGDTLYGSVNTDINRQLLHAYSLSFPSPVSGDIITVKAPLPDDIVSFLDKNDINIKRFL